MNFTKEELETMIEIYCDMCNTDLGFSGLGGIAICLDCYIYIMEEKE